MKSNPAVQGAHAPASARNHVPLPFKLGYSSGQLVEMVVASMLNTFALFYLTIICGLPEGLVGLALGAGLVIDAFTGPLIGSLSDSWNSRFGRRVPFMVAGLVPLLLTFNLIFALPESWGPTAQLIWLTALSIVLRVSLSLFCLPYQALGAELSDDYRERGSIAAWRWGIGILGTVAVIVLGYGVYFAGTEGVAKREAYLWLTLSLSMMVIAGATASIRAGLVNRRFDTVLPASTPLARRLINEMSEVLQNRTFRILFGCSLLFNIAQGINQSMALHLGIFFWRFEPDQIQALGIAAVFGLAMAAPVSGWLAGRMEKRSIVIIGLIGMSVVHIVPVITRLLGWLPDSGPMLSGILAVGSFTGGMMFALAVIGFIAIIPDAVDEHELTRGTRREGMYFAGWEFASKSAHGAGLLISGLALQLIQLPADAPDQATAHLPAITEAWLGFAGGPLSGLLALAAAVWVLRYGLSRQVHAQIVGRLVVRREGVITGNEPE